MIEKYDFGIIRSLRMRKGWSIQDLAKKCDLTYVTVEAIEINKTFPSLRTLDQIAAAFGLSSSNLLSLCEKVTVLKRPARFLENCKDPSQVGVEKCRIAQYDKAKIIRIKAEVGERVQVMKLHEDVYEFCYVLSGAVELTIQGKKYVVQEDETIFFDGLLEHGYRQVEKGEYITVHIPKKHLFFQSILNAPPSAAERESPNLPQIAEIAARSEMNSYCQA